MGLPPNHPKLDHLSIETWLKWDPHFKKPPSICGLVLGCLGSWLWGFPNVVSITRRHWLGGASTQIGFEIVSRDLEGWHGRIDGSTYLCKYNMTGRITIQLYCSTYIRHYKA